MDGWGDSDENEGGEVGSCVTSLMIQWIEEGEGTCGGFCFFRLFPGFQWENRKYQVQRIMALN